LSTPVAETSFATCDDRVIGTFQSKSGPRACVCESWHGEDVTRHAEGGSVFALLTYRDPLGGAQTNRHGEHNRTRAVGIIKISFASSPSGGVVPRGIRGHIHGRQHSAGE